MLVSKSLKRTVEEKIEAMQYLVDCYTADQFKEETIWPEFGRLGPLQSFRDVVVETIRAWKGALADRFETEGIVFAAGFMSRNTAIKEETGSIFPLMKKHGRICLRKNRSIWMMRILRM